MQLVREGVGREPADVPHDDEHRILHGRVGDGAEVPQPPGNQDVEILATRPILRMTTGSLSSGRSGASKQHVLQGEAVLGVVEHVLQAGHRLLRGFDEPQVLAAVEVEVAVDEAVEVVALLEADRFGGVAHPAVKLGADAVEVLGLGALLALADLGGVLAAQPGLEAVGVHFLARIVEFADPRRASGCWRRCAWPRRCWRAGSP